MNVRAVAIPAASAIAAVACCVAASTPEGRFREHVELLASDELAGRGVGTPGIERAAAYIAERFERIGLEPAGEDGTWFQIFPLAVRRSLTDSGRLACTGDEVKRRLGRDFVPFHFSSNDEFDAPVVFCGYGIVNKERNHDDFSELDLDGKVALMLRGEPEAWTAEAGRPTPHAMFRNKVYNAKDRGAAAVLIVNPAPDEGETDELIEFVEQSSEAFGVPAFHITREFGAALLTRAGRPDLAELERRLDDGQFVSQALAHTRCSGFAGLETVEAPVKNVLGVLRGAGPKADECVVIGAHYDHLGVRQPMGRRFRGGKLVDADQPPQIHNGADDNASGVAALIEIAGMFADGPRPSRTIVLIAFTAEESGLHGSRYYVEHPACAIEKTVAMLNMDMIGRMEPGGSRVLVFGADSGKGIEEFVASAAEQLGLTLETTSDTGGRSDHAPFVRKSVPGMHFFTGIHRDYHQPSDDPEKVNAAGGARIAALVQKVADRIANADTRPEFVSVKMSAPAAPVTAPYKVVMGLAPNYAEDDRPGMGVEYVTDDGPADLAGMKGGDRIIRIGNKEVANIYDYMAATRNNKPGDTVTVVVLRESKEVTLRVTLAAAGR